MTGTFHGLSRLDQFFKSCIDHAIPNLPLSQVFGRLFPANPVHTKHLSDADVIAALDALTSTMAATENLDGHADAGMTFLGQFIDHDITLDATSALGTRIDPATIRNVRTPSLDLDCVYGDGPEASPHLYGKDEADHFLVFGRKDNPLDLARTCAGKALIGDPRNDENILVAQVQGIFIELHNILMSKRVEEGEGPSEIADCAHHGMMPKIWDNHVHPKLKNFEEVRRFIRLHYQWVIWNEFLPAFVEQECLDWAMEGPGFGLEKPVMPVEFSGACYRFGHATTQFEYALRDGLQPKGLFQFTGFGPRPEDGNIDMDMFFSMNSGTSQKARPVGPKMGSPLLNLPFVSSEIELAEVGETLTLSQSANLALRNMIRDRYTYQLASGQQVADHLGLDPVAVPDELDKKGITKTPLWFYSLQEAEAGGKLTGVGGRIVASVFANLLKRDTTTVSHIPDFKTWSGFDGQPSVFAGMIAYVEANRGHIEHAHELKCG